MHKVLVIEDELDIAKLIQLHLQDLPFTRNPLSVFADAEAMRRINPLGRVPSVVLDDGEVLIESAAMLDYLDELVGPERAMIAANGPARRHALKICALGSGLADKAVILIYERVLRKDQLKLWVDRCQAQIGGVLDRLEAERAAVATPWWFGTRIGHADIMVACALRFTGEAHPALFTAARYPALTAHAARCEALPLFCEIVQKLDPPKG